MAELDKACTASPLPGMPKYNVTGRCLRYSRDIPALHPAIETFLVKSGGASSCCPLYKEMIKTPEGKQRATAIFNKAKSGYHTVSAYTISELLKS